MHSVNNALRQVAPRRYAPGSLAGLLQSVRERRWRNAVELIRTVPTDRFHGERRMYRLKHPQDFDDIEEAVQELEAAAQAIARGTDAKYSIGFEESTFTGQSRTGRLTEGSHAPEIARRIGNMLNSNQTLDPSDFTLILKVWHDDVAGGSGGLGSDHNMVANYKDARRKKSVVSVAKNDARARDQMCLPMALTILRRRRQTGAPYDKQENRACFVDVLASPRTPSAFKQDVLALCSEAGLEPCPPPPGYGSEALLAFSKALGEQIVVIDYTAEAPELRPYGEPSDNPYFVLFGDQHFDAVVEPHPLFNARGWCHTCMTPIKTTKAGKPVCVPCKRAAESEHPRCARCRTRHAAPDPWSAHPCEDCGIEFGSAECFASHKPKQCVAERRCKTCHTRYKTKDEHVCFTRTCTTCGETYELTDLATPVHRCFIPRVEPKACDGRVYYYDFECYAPEEGGDFIPSLCVVQDDLGNAPIVFPSDYNVPDYVPNPTRLMDELISFILNDARVVVEDGNKRKQATTWVAHNAKGFDAVLVYRAFLDRLVHEDGTLATHIQKPSVVWAGSKIMYMSIGQGPKAIRFIDSMNHVGGPLAGYAATFGLDEVKGYWPYDADTLAADIENAPGLPERSAYPIERMTPAERHRFGVWYEGEYEAEGSTWNLREKRLEYCIQDVNLLRQGFECYRASIRDITRELDPERVVDPVAYVTIAAVAVATWQAHFVPEKTLAIAAPPLAAEQSVSHEANDWLTHQHVEHREVEIWAGGKAYTVDGFAPRGTRVGPDLGEALCDTVYEYDGCFYHGCYDCYADKADEQHPVIAGKTWGDLAKQTYARTQALKRAGYLVVVMRSCEFAEYKAEWAAKSNPVGASSPAINPQDAFFGGRTEPFKLKWEAAEDTDQHAVYQDFTSLYPSVQVFEKYPVGHPTPIYDPTLDLLEARFYTGLIKVDITPPSDLHVPVLPRRTKAVGSTPGKLVFDLEPQTEATFTHVELYLAMDKGYTVTAVHHVLHWDEWTSDAFGQYVDTFMAIKDRATKEGNAGKRAVAKLYLNSLWGKLAMRLNMPETQLCTTYADFHRLMFGNDRITVRRANQVSELACEVTYDKLASDNKPRTFSNVYLACYVTAYGRTRLYRAIDELDNPERLLYCDTDSLVYSIDPAAGDNMLALGDGLGELTDELGGDAVITRFVSTGPKSYAYKVRCTAPCVYRCWNCGAKAAKKCKCGAYEPDKHTGCTRGCDVPVCKSKGFSLKQPSAAREINFDSMAERVDSYLEYVAEHACAPTHTGLVGAVGGYRSATRTDAPIVTDRQFVRTKDRRILLREASKVFNCTFDKRMPALDGTTRPFGWGA